MSLNASSQEVLCRWAEERYGVTGVTKVDFEITGDDGYSGCETCGYGASAPSVEVWVYGEDNRLICSPEEDYAPSLINSIVEVALRG